MPKAAIPDYLGQQNLSTASPGMRFGMYLPIWSDRQDLEKEVNSRARRKSREGREISEYLEANRMDATIVWLQRRQRNPLPHLWDKNTFAAKNAWQRIIELNDDDRKVVEAFNARQQALAPATVDMFSVSARSTAPFTTGMGNEHPLENGFSFLWPYGLPYLPGSGVKGVLRQAARELVSGDWGESEWGDEAVAEVTIGNKLVPLTTLDLLFGLESKDGKQEHFRGVLSFWDVIPEIKGDNLLVEIMTPHQTHYYADGEQPHDSGQPNPISFLTVPPDSGFNFHVKCDLPRFEKLAPALAENNRWKKLLKAAFDHAFDWLGFGAKTAVGYGAMEKNQKASEESKVEPGTTPLSPEEQQIKELEKQLASDQKAGNKQPGGLLNEKRLQLMEAALEWEDESRRKKAAQVIRQTVKFLPWSKKRKKEMNDKLSQLESTS